MLVGDDSSFSVLANKSGNPPLSSFWLVRGVRGCPWRTSEPLWAGTLTAGKCSGSFKRGGDDISYKITLKPWLVIGLIQWIILEVKLKCLPHH